MHPLFRYGIHVFQMLFLIMYFDCYFSFDYQHNKMPSERRNKDSRRYSNIMDLPGVNLSSTPNNLSNSKSNQWLPPGEFNNQERRFFKDLRPFFLLCQLSAMFPNKLDWKLTFSWGYWATYFCILNILMMVVLLCFYLLQVIKL